MILENELNYPFEVTKSNYDFDFLPEEEKPNLDEEPEENTQEEL